jgi:diguanylate cyclase (GGDEF)-like protein
MQTGNFDPQGSISNTDYSVAQKTNHEILQQLFGHTLKAALGHAMFSMLIVYWLADVANLKELSIWFCAITFMSLSRLFLYSAYSKYNDAKNQHFWLHTWAGCSAIMASIYAVGLVHFTPFELPQYTVAIGLFAIALTGGSLMVFSASVYAVLSFLIPIMLIPSYFLIADGGPSGIMTVLAMALYALALLILVNNISKAFKMSILVGLQHQREVTKRKLIEQQLEDINRRDGLTGVFNKRYFDEMLEDEIGRAHRNHQPLCIIMFDLDCFTEYNEQYGHIAGDSCLRDVAEIAQTLASRKGDLVARYGGEEFVIILPNIDLKGAVAFANKLQQQIEGKRLPHEASKLSTLKCVTVSLGVTNLMPFTKVKPSELITFAETALHEAKRQGRNRVHFNENNGLNQSASL